MEMNETSKFADMLSALGAEQRLEIMRCLIRTGKEGMPVGEIQEKLGIPNSTLSHHLEKLRREGLVQARKDRQWIWYSVNLETVGRLVTFLCARCYKPELVEPLLTSIKKTCHDGKKTKKEKTHELLHEKNV